MAKNKETKTNAMRILETKKIPFTTHTYECEEFIDGVTVIEKLGQPLEKAYKTLVTVGKSKNYFVFVIPVAQELDLKKAAEAVSEKSIEMVKSKELLPLTGYIHGGCSPIGMKKFFTTKIDETAILFDTILFSAGKIGFQVEVSLDDLSKAISYTLEDLTVN